MKKNVILDVDTGIDDAMAIALATYSNNINVKLITTIAGNLSVNAVTKNTLDLLQALGKHNIPVAIGAKEVLASFNSLLLNSKPPNLMLLKKCMKLLTLPKSQLSS